MAADFAAGHTRRRQVVDNEARYAQDYGGFVTFDDEDNVVV